MEKQPVVLILDDEVMNIEVVAKMLQERYAIRFALDGQTALKIVAQNDISLILLDIEMPNMNGFEVAQRIIENPDIDKMPIVFLTGHTGEEYLLKGFEIGGDDYITKPFKHKELEVRVDNHIKRYQANKEIVYLNQRLETKIQEEKKLVIEYSKNAALGEMIAAIAHQWRQPLNILMMLFGNLTINSILNKLDHAMVERTCTKGEHIVADMNQTIEDFASFFRPSKERVSFNLKKSIEQVMDIIEEQLRHHTIEVEIFIEDSILLYGYPNEFKHVILNLFTNAKDAIISQGIKGEIVCSFEQVGDDGVITIEDNAGGIPDELLPDTIFEPHFSTKSDGMGLGLYICKMIIQENMHGRLEAHNSDKGACFSIKVPLKQMMENINDGIVS